jgi:hypothetical protein
VLAIVLAMVESENLPLRLARYDGPSEASRWLAGEDGAVLVLPLGEDDTRAMLDSLAHGRPLVNGDSGFVPRPFDRALELFAYGVSPEGLRFLRAVGVRHVVAPARAAFPGFVPDESWPAGVREVARFDSERVAEVEAGESASIVAPGDPAPTRFTPGGPVIVLPEPRTVGRVAFEASDAEWVAAPRVEASLDGVSWEAVEARSSLADATLSLYRDPRQGRGEVRFAPRRVVALRLDPRLPARGGTLEVGP